MELQSTITFAMLTIFKCCKVEKKQNFGGYNFLIGNFFILKSNLG